MSPSPRKRFSHHSVKTSNKETFSLGILAPNTFRNPELAEKECGKQEFIAITLAFVALVMTCDFPPHPLVWRMGNSRLGTLVGGSKGSARVLHTARRRPMTRIKRTRLCQ